MRILPFVIFAIITHQTLGLIQGIKIDTKTSTWRDDRNRSRIWHGVNFVQKNAPFYPTISTDLIEKMNEMGLTAVRLGVQVGGTFPENATLNVEYLDRIEEIVDSLWNAGIATILDMHQDVFSSNICGEGFPNWMVSLSDLQSMEFPRPISLSGSKPNPENNTWTPAVPCSPTGLLKFIGWSEFYMTDACGKAFQGLYDNTSVVAKMVNAHWDAVSKRFAGHDGVLAYEMLNEPWIGDYISHPELLLESGKAEKETVGPFMERIHAIIRDNDKDTPIMYAPAEVNNRAMRSVGYEDGFLAGEPMAFHTYCITGTDGAGPTTPATIELCHFNDDFQLNTREKDLKRLHTAGFITEFGAVSDKPTGIDEVRFVCDHMDKMNPPISWTFWDHNLIFGDVRCFFHVSLSLSL